MDYSAVIRFLRKSNKMSQDDLALLLDIKRHTICDWETGRTEPSISNLITVAKTFNVSINFLLDVEEENYNKDLGFDMQMDYTSFVAKSPLEKDLIEAIMTCTEEQQNIIQNIIEATNKF